MTAQEEPLYQFKKAKPLLKAWPILPRKFFFLFLFLLVAVSAGVFWYSNRAPSPPPSAKAETAAPSGINPQTITGPLYDVWGTIIAVEAKRETVSQGKEQVLATIQARWDVKKDFLIKINDSTRIDRYSPSTASQVPMLQEQNLDWRDLKSGDRINVQSSVEIQDLKEILPHKIKLIEVYKQ